MKRYTCKNKTSALLLIAMLLAALFSGCATVGTRGKVNQEVEEAEKKMATNLYLEGRMAESREDWSQSIASYSEALRYDPDSHEIAASLAKAYFKNGKRRSSLHYIKLAIELNPSEASYWRWLQMLEQQVGNFDEAAKALEMYIKLKGETTFVDVVKLSQYYFTLEETNKAKKVLLDRAKSKETNASEMYDIASLLAFNNLIDEAVSVYNSLIERDPLDVKAWLLLGDLYKSEGDDELALQTYMKALDRNPENVMVYIAIGNNCLVENEWDCSVEYFEKAYAQGKEKIESAGIGYEDIAKTLTAVYFYAGRDNDALALFGKLREEEKDGAELYFSLGKAMNYLNRYEEAEKYYRQGLEKDISNVDEEKIYRVYVGLARALMRQEREDEALDLIRDDAKNNIKKVNILKELEASICKELKQYDDAIAIYEWLNASDPENREYLLGMSLVYDLAGRFEDAEKTLVKTLEMFPEDPLALNNLAYMYLENNVNIQRAMKMVKQSLINEPDNGAYLDTLGWAYYKMGKYKTAKKHIQRALKWADKSDKGIIYEHYGDVLLTLGKKKEAVEAYRNAIEFGEDKEKMNEKINGISK